MGGTALKTVHCAFLGTTFGGPKSRRSRCESEQGSRFLPYASGSLPRHSAWETRTICSPGAATTIDQPSPRLAMRCAVCCTSRRAVAR